MKTPSMRELVDWLHKHYPGRPMLSAIALAVREGKMKKIGHQYVILKD